MRNQNHSADDVDVVSLAGAVKRALPRVIALAAMAGAATFGILSMLPQRFTSEAQLMIGGRGVNDPFRDPKVGSQTTAESVTVKVDREAVASQVIALRSRDLAIKLASELQLARLPEFNAALPPPDLPGKLMRTAGLQGPRPGETEEDRVLSTYYRNLQVYQGKDTRVITIEMTTQSPDLSSRLANRLAELFQDWVRKQGVSHTEGASEWLKPQIETLSREVAEAEAAVERFRSEANLFRGGSQNTGLNEQQLADLAAELTRSQATRSEADARARSARDLLARNRVEAIADVQRSPVIQGLIAQRVRAEREKAEAETTLLAGHPRMKQLNANLTDLRKQVAREAASIVESLEREAKVAAEREQSAKRLLDEAKVRVGATSGDQARLAALEGAAKAKRRELETLQASFEATRSRGDVRSVPLEAQLISRARPSSVPVFPRKGPLSALAGAAALMLGLVFVITRELLAGGGSSRAVSAHGLRGRRQSDNEPALPAAAPTRTAPAAEVEPPRIVPNGSHRFATFSAVADIAHHLAPHAGGEAGYRSLMIVDRSPEDVEDCRALASALAGADKPTLLVDWSMNGKGIAPMIGVAVTPGISDLLHGRASFEDVIARLPESEAHVIACGNAEEGRAALDGDRINLVLDALDEAYDHIIVVADAEGGRELFGAIEGRFDAGIVVAGGRRQSVLATASPGTFLGFDVTDIEVIRLERVKGSSVPMRKMQLARRAVPA